jgi:hypothetical protein
VRQVYSCRDTARDQLPSHFLTCEYFLRTQGDSGGPLIHVAADADQTKTLVGVVSWGNGCARREYPGGTQT